jgi:hypothetical protein
MQQQGLFPVAFTVFEQKQTHQFMQPSSKAKSSVREVVRLDRNMMLTIDEYMALRRLLDSTRESEGATLEAKEKKRTRSASAKRSDKKMSKALAQANADLRKTIGELRKGVTQADVMTRAHRIRRGM